MKTENQNTLEVHNYTAHLRILRHPTDAVTYDLLQQKVKIEVFDGPLFVATRIEWRDVQVIPCNWLNGDRPKDEA